MFEIAGAAIRSRWLRVAENPRRAVVALPQGSGRHPVFFGAGGGTFPFRRYATGAAAAPKPPMNSVDARGHLFTFSPLAT